VEEAAAGAAGFVAGAVAGAVKSQRGSSKAIVKGSKRQRRAPASQKQQQEQQQQQQSVAQQQTETLSAAAAAEEQEAAAALPVVKGTAAAAADGAAPRKVRYMRSEAPLLEQQQPDAVEETWRPAERVLADVTRQQLGVAVGRRATIATLRAGSGSTAAAGKDGRQQTAMGAGGSLTPVAFRTRHRHR
jgi:hypothetical protein